MKYAKVDVSKIFFGKKFIEGGTAITEKDIPSGFDFGALLKAGKLVEISEKEYKAMVKPKAEAEAKAKAEAEAKAKAKAEAKNNNNK